MVITYFKESETIDRKTSEVVRFEREIGFSDNYQAAAEKLQVGNDLLTMICEEENSNNICVGNEYSFALNNQAGGLLGYKYSLMSSNVGNLKLGVSIGAKERRKLSDNNFTHSDLVVIVSTKILDKKESADYSLVRKMAEYLDNYQI